VTGAGGGLGRAIARRLGKQGWGVVVDDIDADRARAVASAIEQDGGRALTVAADATDGAAVMEMVTVARQLLLQAALPDIRAANWGRVVHTGSDMFDRGSFGWSAYMAAKGRPRRADQGNG
jgi:NAD(P)-dependent dehydrogenase (short-subunit alcohol dehydrogenase family)